LPRASAYIANLAAEGRYHFTTEAAALALGSSVMATQAALRRLKKQRLIAAPFRSFHVILPPEYRQLGCLPADQFVPQLMAHLGEAYYATLLTAAEIHGAAHQRPQAFQVMVSRNRRPIACGAVRVQFFARRDMSAASVIDKNTTRGLLRVASPEATAFELVGYASQCGGLDHVANVLAELAAMLDGRRLVAEALKCPIAWAQRLGYLLDLSHHRDLADHLATHVEAHARFVAPLVSSARRAGRGQEARWRLAINADVEVER
jgi:predicted transcriptional regulator of viral defense system